MPRRGSEAALQLRNIFALDWRCTSWNHILPAATPPIRILSWRNFVNTIQMQQTLCLLLPGRLWNVFGILTCLRLIPSCRTAILSLVLRRGSHLTCFVPSFYHWSSRSHPSLNGLLNSGTIIFMPSSAASRSGIRQALALSTISSIDCGSLISRTSVTRSILRRNLQKSRIKRGGKGSTGKQNPDWRSFGTASGNSPWWSRSLFSALWDLPQTVFVPLCGERPGWPEAPRPVRWRHPCPHSSPATQKAVVQLPWKRDSRLWLSQKLLSAWLRYWMGFTQKLLLFRIRSVYAYRQRLRKRPPCIPLAGACFQTRSSWLRLHVLFHEETAAGS